MLKRNTRAEKNEIDGIIDTISLKIFDKRQKIKLLLAAMLTGGHALLEDRPGLGKTTLALALAQVFGMDFKRIQFTSDLMPSDVLGVSIYDREKHVFEYHKGPIFTQFMLADELNRATPKTQSALLEAMAEKQISIDGKTHQLSPSFFVIATQNPLDESGTYPLPDSQLDRFVLSLSLGYPDSRSERKLYSDNYLKAHEEPLPQQASTETLLAWQKRVRTVYAGDDVLDYLQELINKSRNHAQIAIGLSPRAGLALFRASQALAFIDQRDFVTPADIQEAFYPVARHRLVSNDMNIPSDQLIHGIIDETPIL